MNGKRELVDNVRIVLAFTSDLIRVFNGASLIKKTLLEFTRRANATT